MKMEDDSCIFPNEKMQFTYLKYKDDAKYKPLKNEDILLEAGAEVTLFLCFHIISNQMLSKKQLQLYKKYYLSNDCFGGETGKEVILHPPPVPRLYAIYGTFIKCYSS